MEFTESNEIDLQTMSCSEQKVEQKSNSTADATSADYYFDSYRFVNLIDLLGRALFYVIIPNFVTVTSEYMKKC
jgi:hypothetical protein